MRYSSSIHTQISAKNHQLIHTYPRPCRARAPWLGARNAMGHRRCRGAWGRLPGPGAGGARTAMSLCCHPSPTCCTSEQLSLVASACPSRSHKDAHTRHCYNHSSNIHCISGQSNIHITWHITCRFCFTRCILLPTSKLTVKFTFYS